ncbi:P-II family nitrogen regulator [Tindallia californiensis]|uniref:Nitrogen regulatory protein PII n=1 Tax=Tindallia californiensis TaxID=159292 RepID=A0A1H3MPB5_9FIRM|nr:P-II family nitrogen regulator [Tindallia californiensis]SDY77939.1 Nitrogen regulatory protein PII [Tindallia californiensis]
MTKLDCKHYELIYVIVNAGLGSKILKFAKGCGITGGTVMLAKGTIKNPLLELLELNKVRKEIVILGAEQQVAHDTMEKMNAKFCFYKKNHGIAFSIPLSNVLGAEMMPCNNNGARKEVGNPMYQSIMVIVDRGNAELVIEAAAKAGSKGGTIIGARGSGIHETGKLFAMDIEPEKEIVLIISQQELTDHITSSISKELNINEPGKGIIFVQDVSKAYGLY